MNAYGAAAMNQLFTVYAQQNASMAAPVTTASGSLDWTYVASGLTAGSGVAGQLADGMYFVQLDSAGGGVETVLPGNANLDGQVERQRSDHRAVALRADWDELGTRRIYRRRHG